MDGECGASSCGARGDRRGRGTASYVIAQTIPIAYAEIDIDSVGQVEVRHGSASVFDVELPFFTDERSAPVSRMPITSRRSRQISTIFSYQSLE